MKTPSPFIKALHGSMYNVEEQGGNLNFAWCLKLEVGVKGGGGGGGGWGGGGVRVPPGLTQTGLYSLRKKARSLKFWT